MTRSELSAAARNCAFGLLALQASAAGAEAKSRFSGRIPKITVDVTK